MKDSLARLWILLLLLGWMTGCFGTSLHRGEIRPEDAQKSTVHCRAAEGDGAYLHTADNAQIWYKIAGAQDAPTVVYLHEGPGGNAHAFERSVGQYLEPYLRVVCLDQRGYGRSAHLPQGAPTGMETTVEDLELLRKQLGVAQFSLVGHSLGGSLALEYIRAYPQRVARLVLVETIPDARVSQAHQLFALAQAAPEHFPQHRAALEQLTQEERPLFMRLAQAYRLLGPEALQRRIHYASSAALQRHQALAKQSGLTGCRPDSALGIAHVPYVEKPHRELLFGLEVPSIFIAGRRSGVIGIENIEAVSSAWEIPVRWMEKSGHFPFVEEPKAFAQHILEFLADEVPQSVVSGAL